MQTKTARFADFSSFSVLTIVPEERHETRVAHRCGKTVFLHSCPQKPCKTPFFRAGKEKKSPMVARRWARSDANACHQSLLRQSARPVVKFSGRRRAFRAHHAPLTKRAEPKGAALAERPARKTRLSGRLGRRGGREAIHALSYGRENRRAQSIPCLPRTPAQGALPLPGDFLCPRGRLL